MKYRRSKFGCYSPYSTTGGQTTPLYAPAPGRRYSSDVPRRVVDHRCKEKGTKP